MKNENKTIFLKPKFQLGDRVYMQMYGLKLYGGTYASRHQPKALIITGIVYTCDRDGGYSDQSRVIPKTERIEYLTNYDGKPAKEETLFKSVEEFMEKTADERKQQAEIEKRKKIDEGIAEYKKAKMLVADYESRMMTGGV